MVTVLKGGTLIDGTGSEAVKDAVVVIDGERITAAGAAGTVSIPPDATVVDVTGKTVLPGLINTHTHMCWDCVHDLKEQSHYDGPEMVAVKYTMNMRRCLEGGITMIRDMGVPFGMAAVASEAVQAGIVPGPRIVHSGRPLSITGGHAFWMGTREVDGPDGVRQGVRAELKGGASWIKMMASGSRSEGIGRKGTVWVTALPEFTADELKAAADEAHAAGKKITAHATEVQSIHNCVLADFDCIEHGGEFYDETLAMMVEKGIWVVPTLSPAYLQVERGASIGMPAFEIERRKTQLLGKDDPVIAAKKAGVRLAMGTDAGSPAVFNNEVVREIELMHEFGMCDSPLDAIVTATRNGAQLLGVDRELGTLEKGKQADILVVDGDPLADLGNLRNVALVYLGGELMTRDGVVIH